MAQESPNDRRRSPRQARSKETVRAILEATAQILQADGFERASTNRIARRAGVSIGTLYQYFPNKEAIVRALCESYIERLSGILGEEFERSVGTGLEAAVRAVIHGIVRAEAAEPELNSLLHERVPQLISREHVERSNEALRAAVAARLSTGPGRQELRPDIDVDRAAFVLVHATLGVITATFRQRPEALADGSLAEELTTMCVGYLRATG